MDRKMKTLEAELRAVSEATGQMYHLLKCVNQMALNEVSTCKLIPKSKANEKLEAYMQATKLLGEIKGRIVTDSVTLEKFLYSIGYIEDNDDEADISIDGHSSTQTSITAAAETNALDFISSDANLYTTCNPNVSNSVRSEPIASTISVEYFTTERIVAPDITLPDDGTELSKTEIQHSSRILHNPNLNQENLSIHLEEIMHEDGHLEINTDSTNSSKVKNTKSNGGHNEEQLITKTDCSIATDTTTNNEINVEKFLEEKKILSMEEKYLNSLLEKSHAPDLRLQRSSSISSSASFASSSTNSSRRTGSNMKLTLKEVIGNSSTVTDIKIDAQDVQDVEISDRTTFPLKCNKIFPVNYSNEINNMEESAAWEDTLKKNFLKPYNPKVAEDCIISAFKNPQNMHIQLKEQCDSLLALNDNLNVAYEHSPLQYTIKSEAKESIGDCCATYMEDYNSWYRAKVLDWQLSSRTNTVSVFLIDYGDTIKVPVEWLRKLLSEFFDYPMFAVPCSLEGLHPPSSTEGNINTIWTTAELNAFYEFMKGGNQVLYKLTYVNIECDPIGIDLRDIEDTNLDKSLGQDLINANIVKQIFLDDVKPAPSHSIMLEQIKLVQGLQGTSKDMTETERLAKYLENDRCTESKNVVEALTGYDANDERRVCRFTRRDGTCFKGLNCKLEHTQLRPDGFTTDKNFVYHKALHTFILPSVDDEIKIFITCITRPNEFYGHILERDEMRIYGTSLQQLEFDLKNPLAIRRFQHLSMQPSAGQIVLAKNWDGTWCRSRVLQIDGLTVDVFIVDYGETVNVSMDDLREISQDYLVLPFQAAKFYLWDFEKAPDVTDDEILTFMESRYLCIEYAATVRACIPHLYVDVRTAGEVDMSDDLITNGLARRAFGKQLIIETSLVE